MPLDHLTSSPRFCNRARNKSGQARNPSGELKAWGERRRKVEALEEQRRLKRELADDFW